MKSEYNNVDNNNNNNIYPILMRYENITDKEKKFDFI